MPAFKWMTSNVLLLAAAGEAVTGLALLIAPSQVIALLFGAEQTGAVIPVARIAGLALIALAVACGPYGPAIGMLVYSAAAALYLAHIGFAGNFTGLLLWSAVALHVVLTALLGWACASNKIPQKHQ